MGGVGFSCPTKFSLETPSKRVFGGCLKNELGKPDFNVDPGALYNGLLMAGYEELPVTGRHALLVSTLPPLRKDPFDRLMPAQSVSQGITFMTADRLLEQYPASVIVV